MADRKPSVDELLELLKATGEQEVANLEERLCVIVERYEEVRALVPGLFSSPLLDDVATIAWDTRQESRED